MATVAMSALRYFKYFAFISYSRKDEAFAKRLQNFLMGFKLPTRLCKQYPEKPQSLRPIYRDKNDLGVDNLNEGLKHGLNLSKFLIVICSENSARPNEEGKNWIDEEVRTFLSLEEGNGKYVIPVLLRQKEQHVAACLPPAVKELGLLAADVSDKGEKRVFSDVAAKMLGLEPDELWNWWERAQRRKRRILQTLGGIAAVSAIYTGWLAWDYYAPHYTYFADYVECNNIPQGIRPLTKKETKHLHSYYRFTTQYHRLTRVDTLNSAGYPRDTSNLPERNERPVSMELDYSAKTGKVTTQIYYDKVEKVVQKRNVGAKSIQFRVAAKEGEETVDLGAGNASLMLSPFEVRKSFSNKNVARFEVERDDQGFITLERFSSDKDKGGICNEEGAWGRRYRRDTQGRPLEITNIDQNDAPLAVRSGIASTRYTYYPTTGQVDSISYHDAQGNLVCCAEGYATRKNTYNAQGNQTSVSYFNTEGQPCLSLAGFASVQGAYDSCGNLIDFSYFDTKGQSCMSVAGFAHVKATYDSKGSQICEKYFDTADNPCLCNGGFAGLKVAYDSKGNRISTEYFDTTEKPCLSNAGFASVKYTYSRQGNLTCSAYFNTEGNPCLSNAGFASVKYTYDCQGNQTSEAYFDTEGKPCASPDGYIKRKLTRDSMNNRTFVTCFDTKGERCVFNYDSQGNLSSIEYLDASGSPRINTEGYTKVTITYEPQGNWVIRNAVDMNGASKKSTLDSQGNLLSVEYFDAKGNPRTGPEGYIKQKFTYDTKNNLISVISFDITGASHMLNYDAQGLLVSDICFDTEGASVQHTFDTRGNVTSEAYFDTKGKPCTLKGGYASLKAAYDAQGNRISEAYFDTEGNPCLSNAGFACANSTYDLQGHKTSEAYFDTKGDPCMLQDGFASWTATYDEHGYLISLKFFDSLRRARKNKDGFASLEATNNLRGQRIYEEYFDTEGHPCMCINGFASRKFNYDSQGNQISVEFFDTEGKPVFPE